MPFLRFSRDARGYEHFYIVHSTTRRGKSRSRILYWFRTPPNVKVGREAFDEGVRAELEAQNPNVTFDWVRLLETPIPPPSADVEHWRERRRATRAAKLAASSEAEIEEAVADSEPPGVDAGSREPAIGETAPQEDVASAAPAELERTPSQARRRRRRNRRRGSIGSVAAAGGSGQPPPHTPSEQSSKEVSEQPDERPSDEPEGE